MILAESNRIAAVTREIINAEDAIEASDWAERTRSIGKGLDVVSAENWRFFAQVRGATASFPDAPFATQCGFRVCNAEITSWTGDDTQYEISADSRTLQADIPPQATVSTLLGFSNGYHVLLPAIGGFVATLHFQADHLAEVSYEPAMGTNRWELYQPHRNRMRQLRAAVAASLRGRPSRMDGECVEILADRVQLASNVDISLALYAASAYRNWRRQKRIEQIAQAMRRDIGFVMFDIALMAGHLNGQNVSDMDDVLPPFPLLSPTWALVPALEITLPVPYATLQRCVHPISLWTLYTNEAAELLTPRIESGELR